MELVISIAVNAVLGVVLLGLLYWKGTRDSVRLVGPDEAIAAFKRHYPDAQGSATLAADGRSALIDLHPEGGIGLLQRQGRRWNARVLLSREISAVRVGPDGALEIAFADFGWPRARIALADPQTRARWLARLNALTVQPPASPSRDLRHA
jgi:hypothetical protein